MMHRGLSDIWGMKMVLSISLDAAKSDVEVVLCPLRASIIS